MGFGLGSGLLLEDKTLISLIEDFGSDERCRAYLEELRWPGGPVCLRCEGVSISRILARNQYECNAKDCRYQFSVTAGTLIHDSHLPPWKWFLAVYLMCESKNGISASSCSECSKCLARPLGISPIASGTMGERGDPDKRQRESDALTRRGVKRQR